MRASLMLIRPDEFVALKRKHKELIVVFGSCGDESVGFTIRKKTTSAGASYFFFPFIVLLCDLL